MSCGLCLLAFKGCHLAGVEEAFGVVAVLGLELCVVFAVAAAAFDVVDVGVGDADAVGAAESDDLVEAVGGGEANDGDGCGEDGACAVLHPLDVVEKLFAEGLFEESELLGGAGGIEAALEVGVGGIGLHGPEGCVVPGVIGKERLRAQACVGCGVGESAACGLCEGLKGFALGVCDEEEDESVAITHNGFDRREERGDGPLEDGDEALGPGGVFG